MSDERTPEQNRKLGWELYRSSKFSFDEIAHQCNVKLDTVRSWARADNWRNRRAQEVAEALETDLVSAVPRIGSVIRKSLHVIDRSLDLLNKAAEGDAGKGLNPFQLMALTSTISNLDKLMRLALGARDDSGDTSDPSNTPLTPEEAVLLITSDSFAIPIPTKGRPVNGPESEAGKRRTADLVVLNGRPEDGVSGADLNVRIGGDSVSSTKPDRTPQSEPPSDPFA